MDSKHDIPLSLPPHMRLLHPQPAAAAGAEPLRSHSQPRSENWLPAPRPSLAPLAAPDTRQTLPLHQWGHEPATASGPGPMRRAGDLGASTRGSWEQRQEATRGPPPPMQRQPAPSAHLGPMQRSEELAGSVKAAAPELSEATRGSRGKDMQPTLLDGAAEQSNAELSHGEAHTQNGQSAVTASARVGSHGRAHSAAAATASDVRHRSGSTRALPRIAEHSLRSSLRRRSPRSRSRSPRARAPPEQRAEASETGARRRSSAGRSPRRLSPARRSRCAGLLLCLQPHQKAAITFFTRVHTGIGCGE